ncbi:MAG: DinB family protein [Ardenticatenaceae bacterium]
MKNDKIVRQQLLELLQGGNAYMPFEWAVTDFPVARINEKAPNVPYSAWELLEHVRISQWDILQFIRDPDHVSPTFPVGYWPVPGTMADETQWQNTLDAFQADWQALIDMIEDPNTDLYGDLPHAAGYHILQQILVVADHNAYHIGELGILRQVMGTWPPQAENWHWEGRPEV